MAFLLSILLTTQTLSIKINPQTRFFQDDQNRSLLFHGVNAVFKTPPYLPIMDRFDPQMSISDEDMQDLKNWGLNFVRLGVMWESVETAPGVYNSTYLSQMNDLVTRMGQYGIYTLVDAHQDIFARKICGEGVPDFYAQNLDNSCSNYSIAGWVLQLLGVCTPMSSYKFDYDANGDPVIDECLKHMFALYYATPEAMSAFENLYLNKNGLQDAFIKFWEATATAFKDNPYVLGYDIINEPAGANYFRDPLLAIPGTVDYKYLQPLYQRFSQTIRKIDNEKIIFFEPIQGDLLPIYGGIVFNTGFTETPGGQEYNDRQILNDHSYCCQASPSMCSTGEPPISAKDTCKAFHQSRLETRSQNAQSLGVGLFLTEFGACSNTDACVAEITSTTEACDSQLVSWGYWMFKGFNDFTTSGNLTEGFYDASGNLQQGKVKALSRTYAQAFQGVPQSMAFDSTTGKFTTTYTVNSSTAPTIIYYNKQYYYPNGVTVTAVNNKNISTTVNDNQNGIIEILTNGGEGSTVSVTIIPKTSFKKVVLDEKLELIIEESVNSEIDFTSQVQQVVAKIFEDSKLICEFSAKTPCKTEGFLFKPRLDLYLDEILLDSAELPPLFRNSVTLS